MVEEIKEMLMKRILITGGLGFVGSNLAEKCVGLGYDVTILSRSDSKIGNIKHIKDKVKLIILDIRDIDKEVKGFDIIFHLASTTDNYHILDDPYKDIEVNCHGTIALLEACRKHNPGALILFASTFFVNGNPDKLPVTPESPCNPLGLYGATRLAGEHFCRAYNRIFDLKVIIVRFTNLFGVKEQADNKKKAGFNYLIGLAIKGEEIPLYNNGDFIRDYIYIDDAITGCLTAAEKGKIGEIYYIGRGEHTKFRELIDIVIKEAGGGKVKPVDPPDFHNRIGIKDFVCDNTPLKELGWKPEVSLKEGIKRTIKHYR